MGAPRALALCACFAGVLDFTRGRWDAAECELREAVEVYRRLGAASGEALSLQRLGNLLTARGRLEDARDVLDEGLFAAERAVMRTHCLSRLHASLARHRLAAGDVATAVEAIRAAGEAVERHGGCLTCDALVLPEAVRVALARGDAAAAESGARRLEGLAERFRSRAWTAMARQARGRVLLSLGLHRPAADAFRDAREAYRGLETSYEAARCGERLADCLAALGEAREAEECRTDAAAVYRALGASGLEG